MNTSLLGYILQPYHVCVTAMFYFGFTIFNRSIKTLFLNTVLTQLKSSSRISVKFAHSALIFISKKISRSIKKKKIKLLLVWKSNKAVLTFLLIADQTLKSIIGNKVIIIIFFFLFSKYLHILIFTDWSIFLARFQWS